MKPITVILLLFPVLLFANSSENEMRKWTSDVRSTVVARFVELRENNVVVLQTETGRMIEIPRHRLSSKDREWIHFTLTPETEERETRPENKVEAVSVGLDELAADLTERLTAYAADQGFSRVILNVGFLNRNVDEATRRHAIRTIGGLLVRQGTLTLIDLPPKTGISGAETGFREIWVDFFVGDAHREGYLTLSLRNGETERPAWIVGGYFTLSEKDREWLGLRPTGRNDRFLPRWKTETLEDLAEIRKEFSGRPVLLSESRFSGLEEKLVCSLLVEQLISTENQEEPVADSEDRLPVVFHVEKVGENSGVSVYDFRAVEEETGEVLSLKSLALERERETLPFLRKRMRDFWDLDLSGDADRILEICRWVDDGQRRTLVQSVRIRHENYLSRTREYRHEVGEVRVLEDCAVVVVNTTYADGGSGSGNMMLIVDEGEWKVWSFEKPQLSQHGFSPDQKERLLQLREWGWDRRNVPEEIRERVR